MAPPLFKRTCGSLLVPGVCQANSESKSHFCGFFDHTPSWTYLELPQIDVGQFFDLLRFENQRQIKLTEFVNLI